jgi:hypothetical protein
VPNAEMGGLFQELISEFAEASNEEAGTISTLRKGIRLIVELLFVEDSDTLSEPGIVRTRYDPTARTGGMRSVAEEPFCGRTRTLRVGSTARSSTTSPTHLQVGHGRQGGCWRRPGVDRGGHRES